jgi:hypothetical protein
MDPSDVNFFAYPAVCTTAGVFCTTRFWPCAEGRPPIMTAAQTLPNMLGPKRSASGVFFPGIFQETRLVFRETDLFCRKKQAIGAQKGEIREVLPHGSAIGGKPGEHLTVTSSPGIAPVRHFPVSSRSGQSR